MDEMNYKEAKTIDEKISMLKSHQMFVYFMLSDIVRSIPKNERDAFYRKYDIDQDVVIRSIKARLAVQNLEDAGFSYEAAFDTASGVVLGLTEK